MVAVASAVYSSIPSDESHLLDLARQGDALAFMQLFRRHQPMLRRMCASKLHLSDDETDDVLQETSIKGLANILQFENKSQFSSWLYRIAKNTGLSYLHSRAGRARDFPSLDDEDQAVALQQEPATQTEIDPVLLMLQQEDDDRFARLYVAVSRQSPDFREVVNRKLRGEEEETIANDLGLKNGTVKSRFFRATEDLEKRYAQTTVENIPAEDTLFGLFMQQCFEGSAEDRKELLGIWREEKCQAPLSEADIIERARMLNPLIGTPEFKGNDHLRPEARNALNRLELCLLLGWRGLPGGQTIDFILYKNDLLPKRPPLTEAFIVINFLKHYVGAGKLPTAKDGNIPDLKDESWRSWQVALSRKTRGLENVPTWDGLLAKHGLRLGRLTEDLIIEHALAHHQKFGVLPDAESGRLFNVLGENWNAIDDALKRGLCGLPGNSSLHKLYIKHNLKLGELSENKIIGLIFEHLAVHQRFPARHMLEKVGSYIGETWSALAQALQHKRRGLTREISLSALIREVIVDQAEKHFARTGEIPSRASGPLTDYPQINWKMVDDGLRNYGSTAKSYLEKYLKDVKFEAPPVPVKFVKIPISLPVSLYTAPHLAPPEGTSPPRISALNLQWGAKDAEHHHRPAAAVPDRGEEDEDNTVFWNFLSLPKPA